jgi:hypothetical protein
LAQLFWLQLFGYLEVRAKPAFFSFLENASENRFSWKFWG